MRPSGKSPKADSVIKVVGPCTVQPKSRGRRRRASAPRATAPSPAPPLRIGKSCPRVRQTNSWEEIMIDKLIRLVLAPLGALVPSAGVAAAKVTIAVGGAGCLCYLPTVLAEQLGEFKKAGVEVELINFKGGSQALTAGIGGSADGVGGCVSPRGELA